MTVAELIAKLQEMPQDADVVVGLDSEAYDPEEVEFFEGERPSYIGSGPGMPPNMVHCRRVRIG